MITIVINTLDKTIMIIVMIRIIIIFCFLGARANRLCEYDGACTAGNPHLGRPMDSHEVAQRKIKTC